MSQRSSSDAARRARVNECLALAATLAGLTRELDRIEDTKGIGAAYYAKLDQCTHARHELGEALLALLHDRDRQALREVRERAAGEAGLVRAIDQALADGIAQYVDDEQVRHEMFAVPVMLPRAFASSRLSPAIRAALAKAWLRLHDSRDHDEDELTIDVLPALLPPARIEALDEMSAYAWIERRAARLAAAEDRDDDGEDEGGDEGDEDGDDDDDGDAARAGGGERAIRGADDAADPDIEHWDETPMALRYLVIHVATPPEWLDDDESMPADDLRPYLPNFADLPKNHLDWSADARKALAGLTRGHINVGFPDDLLAARVSGRYFTQFWLASYALNRRLKAIEAEDDAAQIACSLHRQGLDAAGKPRLTMRICVLDDDGDLLAGHVVDLDDAFTLEVAQPLIGDLALALSIDEQTTVPGLHELPDERPGHPMFHTASGWRTQQ